MSVSRFEPGALQASRVWLCLASLALIASLSGCATPTVQQHYAHGHEYFSRPNTDTPAPRSSPTGSPFRAAAGNT